MPTFGSLFTGIGGIDLGLERAGWHCVWQVEIDPFRRAILEKHWPDVLKHGAIEEVDLEQLEVPDLIAGGFPCQPVSCAGRRQGTSDPRWLWPQFARVVAGLRPRYVLVENVPGLLHRGMGDVLVDLAEAGYDAEWCCLPAGAFGAPHIRDRVWLVAHTYSEPLVGSAIPQQEQHPWETEPDVGRVVDGAPARMDRIRALGDAVVPQVVEYIGRQILKTTGIDNN